MGQRVQGGFGAVSDKYNSFIAKILAKLNRKSTWAITISANTTLYSESEGYVAQAHTWRKHEDFHKADIAAWQQRKGRIWGWVSWMATPAVGGVKGWWAEASISHYNSTGFF